MKKLLSRMYRLTERQYFYTTTILAAIIAMLTSLLVGIRQSVWFDEAYSVEVARAPFGELLRLAAIDTHPPLYYMVLKLWATMFGWSELALRSLSVVALGATIVVAALLVRRMFNARAAMVVTIFMVVAPMMLRYGFEIRMYSLAALIGVTATYLLIRAVESTASRKWWIAYSIMVAIGMMTVYYLAFIWIAHLVWLAVRSLRDTPHTRGISAIHRLLRQPWTYAYLGSIALFIPWLMIFVNQLGNGALAPIGQPMNIESIIGIFSFNFVYKPLWQLDMPHTILMLFVIVMTILVVVEAFRLVREQRHRDYLALLLSYVMTPVAVLMIVSFVRAMYVERYLVIISVALIMLVGASIYFVLTRENRRHRMMLSGAQLLFIVILVGMVNMIAVGNFNFQRLQDPLIRDAVASLGKCNEQTTIVAADPYVMTELSYYVPANCRVKFYAPEGTLGGGYGPLDKSPMRMTDVSTIATPTVWYVYYGDPKLTFADGYEYVTRERFDSLNVAKLAR